MEDHYLFLPESIRPYLLVRSRDQSGIVIEDTQQVQSGSLPHCRNYTNDVAANWALRAAVCSLRRAMAMAMARTNKSFLIILVT